jgi:hypothetical protein
MDYGLMVRFFGLVIISLYVYMKILNIKEVAKQKIVAAVLFSLVMSVPLSFVPFLYEFIFLGSVGIFVWITARVELPLMVSAVLISVGISLGIDILVQTILLYGVLVPVETINTLIVTSQNNIPWETLTAENVPLLITPMVAAALPYISLVASLVFVGLFFNRKRLRGGFAFLYNRETRLVGVIFSVFIMVLRSFWDIIASYTTSDVGLALVGLFFLLAMNMCTVGIHFWWRNHMSLVYQQRLKERVIQEYQIEMDEKDEAIRELSECNELLAHAVHRDNKLIPALYHAVNSFINDSQGIAKGEAQARGTRILADLDEIMQERKEMITGMQREHTPLPSTGIERVDNVLNYAFQRATEKGIQFDFIAAANVAATNIKDSAEAGITKQDLEALIAELLENALTAVGESPYKRILVTMGIVGDCLEITVQDSGMPFDLEILANLGVKKATTHADTGGSGIGYLSIFSILKQCQASLLIAEQAPEKPEDSEKPQDHTFSKSIKVRFDGRSQFVIHSHRAAAIKSASGPLSDELGELCTNPRTICTGERHKVATD